MELPSLNRERTMLFSRATTKIHKIEKAANCARRSFVVTPRRSSRPLSIFHHSTSFLIPCNAMVRSTWNNAEYTMHIYAIYVWCTKWQRGLGRMVCALTRVADEVPVLVELTQPWIHCIALENNGVRFFLLFLSTLSFSVRLPFTLFLFSISLLTRFPSLVFSENVTVPSTYLSGVPGRLLAAFAALARRLFSFHVRFPFLALTSWIYGVHSLFPLNVHISYRIENYFWCSLSSIWKRQDAFRVR